MSLARREIFRDAVFLWIVPFFAPLSMMDWARFSCFKAASLSDESELVRISFTMFLIRVLAILFLNRRLSFCLTRFIADL